MHIKILGPGCARCRQTEQLVRELARARSDSITVETVNDLKEMMILGVMATPALVIDGVVKSTGRIPSREEITAWIEAGSTGAVHCRSSS